MTYRNKTIERKVLEFLKTLPAPLLQFPFNPMDAATTLRNCKIHSYQAFSKRHDVSVDDVISFCQSYTGCTHFKNNNFIIMYNDSLSIIRARIIFTLAHELGHILSGHFNNVCYKMLAQNDIHNKTLEREANHFAACLLSPTPIIHKLKPNSISDIQCFFGLSYEAAVIAWSDYVNYDRIYNISWHNDILNIYKNFLSSRI